MDQRAGEKEEHSSEDSRDHEHKDDVYYTAAQGGTNSHGDHQRDGGYEADEITAGVLTEVDVVGGSEEDDSAPPLFAHPCSLLQLLLRACAGRLSLYGYCIDDEPKPAADDNDDDDVPDAAVAESPQEGDHQGGGDKAAGEEVVTQVRSVRRRPPPPGRPREGPGGNGGNHH